MKSINRTLLAVLVSVMGFSAANAMPSDNAINYKWSNPNEAIFDQNSHKKQNRTIDSAHSEFGGSFELSCYGCTSETTGRPRTEYVRPHVRSNGTYVDGYWRS